MLEISTLSNNAEFYTFFEKLAIAQMHEPGTVYTDQFTGYCPICICVVAMSSLENIAHTETNQTENESHITTSFVHFPNQQLSKNV